MTNKKIQNNSTTQKNLSTHKNNPSEKKPQKNKHRQWITENETKWDKWGESQTFNQSRQKIRPT
jgi:hypothetical protein